MKLRQVSRMFVFTFAVFLMKPLLGLSAVSLTAEVKGALLITDSKGEVIAVEPGDPLPPSFDSGTNFEISDGNVTLAADEGEMASASCLGVQGALTGPGTVTVSCSEEEGLIKVLSGNFSVLDPRGKTRNLGAGEEFPIRSGFSEEVLPTEADNTPGLPSSPESFGALNVPDSRNIETSPS